MKKSIFAIVLSILPSFYSIPVFASSGWSCTAMCVVRVSGRVLNRDYTRQVYGVGPENPVQALTPMNKECDAYAVSLRSKNTEMKIMDHRLVTLSPVVLDQYYRTYTDDGLRYALDQFPVNLSKDCIKN